MTLLLLSWVLFAPVFLLLRWAIRPGTARPSPARQVRSPAHVAQALYVSQKLLDGVFTHATRAYVMGAQAQTGHMLVCLRQGTDALLLDLRADVASWAEATLTLARAPFLAPLPRRQLRYPELRALACAELLGHLAVVSPAGRLRLRFAVLRVMLTVFLWKVRRLNNVLGVWRELERARTDLIVLLDEARCGHQQLVDASHPQPLETVHPDPTPALRSA